MEQEVENLTPTPRNLLNSEQSSPQSLYAKELRHRGEKVLKNKPGSQCEDWKGDLLGVNQRLTKLYKSCNSALAQHST